MKKDIVTVIGILILALILAAALNYSVGEYKARPKFEITKIRVDSVSSELRYPNLPFKVWNYHTSFGVFTSNKSLYQKGDSIEVEIHSHRKK